jgi:hypothetical protein
MLLHGDSGHSEDVRAGACGSCPCSRIGIVLDVLLVRDGRAIPVAPGGPLPDTTALQLEVRHVDGRAWQVTVRREALATRRAESCGGEELDALVWRTAGVSQATRWA